MLFRGGVRTFPFDLCGIPNSPFGICLDFRTNFCSADIPAIPGDQERRTVDRNTDILTAPFLQV